MSPDLPQPSNALLRDLMLLAKEADALELDSAATVRTLQVMRGYRIAWSDSELGLRDAIDEYLIRVGRRLSDEQLAAMDETAGL